MRKLLLSGLFLSACSAPTPPPQFPLPDPASPGARLVQGKCSQCHGPPQPTAHVAEEWTGVVDRMLMHRLRKAYPALTAEEKATLLDYLRAHARGATP